ncbi:MAG: efflux RND transporter periplasmic adaptor subunit [Bacteroidota bacterium]
MKKLMNNRWVFGSLVLIIGLLIGWMIKPSNHQTIEPSDHHDHQHIESSDNQTWTCSMHPQIREDGPGKCPLCSMDLIPVANMETEAVGMDEIQMTEAAMKIASIQTMKVSKAVPQKQVYLPGKIEADERNIATVTAHFDGRVEKLYADFTGQFIRKGQRLATIYSPDLVTAQKELFEALKFKATNPSFYEAAIQKLKLWELTDSQIQGIIEKGAPQYRFSVYAPRSGTILSRKISEGEHVKDGHVLFEIADLSRLWVLFDAYESDIAWIKVGDSISFKVQSIPNRTFESVVTFIDPVVNEQTRTASIRTEVLSLEGQLKPAMFVEGIVDAGSNTLGESLLIPKSAVLWTGKRAVVYVKQPGFERPTFQFREIALGTEAGDYYVVIDGLSEGEEVAANGVFKIDAAAQLQGKISMMNPNGGKASAGHDHGAMEMSEDGQADHSTYKLDIPEVNIARDTFEVDRAFTKQIKSIFDAYLPLKDALIQTDAQSASKESKPLLAAIETVDMSLLTGSAHEEWMKDLAVLRASTQIMLDETDVEKIRAALSPLSDQLYQTIIKFNVQTGGYRQYCPMAFDFEGAFWLSNSDEVLNPYFGDLMLTCGNVDETLK